ncbi:MAG: 1-acyl-sn-glycerol-3-phosphate acyltransferase [Anaerolineae bacterium]|nr:1-acyl-sn-glycerol-3-phosphate acyltransferase [Anaerolineae bacterium]
MSDFFESLGLSHFKFGRRLIAPFIRPIARRFAEQIVTFDDQVGANGLMAGSKWLMGEFTRGLVVSGAEHVPTHGPILFASNHPGMADTIALFSSIPRPDLKIVAAVRPFLRSLPNVSKHLIYVSDDATDRMRVVRETAAHLRRGGAVLTFPAGKIEPDPDVLPGAVASLDTWGESIGVFMRLAPQTQLVPTIVRGVVSAAALHNPLTHLRRKPADRERMAAGLQIMFPRYHDNIVKVTFGPPTAPDLLVARAKEMV